MKTIEEQTNLIFEDLKQTSAEDACKWMCSLCEANSESCKNEKCRNYKEFYKMHNELFNKK